MDKKSVLLVSIDAVKPDLVFNQEKYGIKLPTLNRLIKEGTFAKNGVKSVFPSFTYCCHQSMITGTYPEKHGIVGNKYFDPMGKHNDAWFWYTSSKVSNLWEEAKKNGYLSVNIGLPTSVLADADYNIPEYWRDTTELDSKILSAISHPKGIVDEVEEGIGKNIPCGLWDIKDDIIKLNSCIWMLDNKIKNDVKEKPLFMTTYFASYDDYAHNEGTYGKVALSYLEKTDELLGELIEKVKEITNNNVVICVVSDHGMIDNLADLRPNVLFEKNGLINVDENGNILDWKVFCQRMGGAGYIKLKNPEDKIVKEKVEDILSKLTKDEDSKIVEYMTGNDARIKRHGMQDADYVLISKPGYEIREDVQGDFESSIPSQKAQHGYMEEIDDMKAILFMQGPGIKKNNGIDEFNLVDIAPTLANVMGFDLEDADGINRI